MASVVSMKSLLEAGVHFGHQTRRWNPKMAPYIYTERNGIYIVDLQKTVKKLEEAYAFVRQLSENGQSLLFVGTKKLVQTVHAGTHGLEVGHHAAQPTSVDIVLTAAGGLFLDGLLSLLLGAQEGSHEALGRD